MEFKKLKLVNFFILFLTFFSIIVATNDSLVNDYNQIKTNYYGDFKINVDSFGYTTISGITNYLKFKNIQNSQNFISKNKNKWFLNISTNEVFDEFIYELILPSNSKITYLKTTPNFRIEEDKGFLKIIGYGSNKSLIIQVQYEVDNLLTDNEDNISFELILIIILSFIVFICLIVIFYMLNKIKKLNKEIITESTINQNENLKNVEKIDLSILPERQKQIINILKNNGKMTQKKLEELINIPKSSLSRNIKILETKNIIKKESIGITNYLSLNEK